MPHVGFMNITQSVMHRLCLVLMNDLIVHSFAFIERHGFSSLGSGWKLFGFSLGNRIMQAYLFEGPSH